MSFLIFASGVSFEKYACSISTDFFIFDGDGSNVLVLDSTNFLFTGDFLFDSVFCKCFGNYGKTDGIAFLCSQQC